jgi:pyruvate dehydrogenase E1 component alpha subunit
MAEAALTPMSVDLEPVQLVAPDGTPTAEVRYSRELPAETLCWLYEMMMVTRGVDAEFINLQRQGELALFAAPRCTPTTRSIWVSRSPRPAVCWSQ